MNYQRRIINKNRTGEKIRQIIINSKFTFEDIADYLGFTSPRVIYDWISGIKLPSLESLFNFCLIFNVKMEDIIVLI